MSSNDQIDVGSDTLSIHPWRFPNESGAAAGAPGGAGREGILKAESSMDLYPALLYYAQHKSGIVLLLPIQEVLQVVNEGGLIEDALLRERLEIKWIGQTLNELQLKFETLSVRRPGVQGYGFTLLRHATSGGCTLLQRHTLTRSGFIWP